jgi:hypothetical protein
VAEPLIDFLAREYEYVRPLEGDAFFLELRPYAERLKRRRATRKALERIERDTLAALAEFVREQNAFVSEAKEIRQELAARAPEIDNSEMERPHAASHDRARYDLDSFARFDELEAMDVSIGFPTLPDDAVRADPGTLPDLFVILRGRLHAAEHGEDASFNAPRIRDDLDDLGRRIGNLTQRAAYALRRYRQEARTLPGVAYGRLVYFGTDLNPEAPQVETDEDVARWLDQSLREWGQPRTLVRQLVNAEQLDDHERETVAEVERQLKGELDRLHQELTRVVAARWGTAAARWARDHLVRRDHRRRRRRTHPLGARPLPRPPRRRRAIADDDRHRHDDALTGLSAAESLSARPFADARRSACASGRDPRDPGRTSGYSRRRPLFPFLLLRRYRAPTDAAVLEQTAGGGSPRSARARGRGRRSGSVTAVGRSHTRHHRRRRRCGVPPRVYKRPARCSRSVHRRSGRVERGLQGHADTQNALADILAAAGIAPRSPRADEPNFDLAWERDGVAYVAEVKSITRANEERQLRLGLGQVLRYRGLLRERLEEVRAVLVAEHEPSDPSWRKLCEEVDVSLVVPPHFEGLR